MIRACKNIFLLCLLVKLQFSALQNSSVKKQQNIPYGVSPAGSLYTKETANLNDWEDGENDPTVHGFITEERRDELEIFHSPNIDGLNLDENTKKYLSVYPKEPLKFRVPSEDRSSNRTFFVENVTIGEWTDIIISRIDSSTIQILSKDNTVIYSIKIDFKNWYFLYLESAAQVLIHETFKYTYATTVTNKQEMNSFTNVTLANDGCISTFASVGKNSLLEITLISNNKTTTKTVSGFNQTGNIAIWEEIPICIPGSSGLGKLSFVRKHRLGHTNGYWAVDPQIRSHRPENGRKKVKEGSNTEDYRRDLVKEEVKVIFGNVTPNNIVEFDINNKFPTDETKPSASAAISIMVIGSPTIILVFLALAI